MDKACLILFKFKNYEKINYSALSGNAVLKQAELLTLKGGYIQEYGCESNVCSTDRSGAKDLCSDAYCKSGVGPKNPGKGTGTVKRDKCLLFTSL
ncbi:MAG: hypothetical protein SOX84_00720 [Prevotella sp.]|nr:hypothetical protein [Prevotella sp.]MDY4217303.1 hypothetical protein [Prevotella sp.]